MKISIVTAVDNRANSIGEALRSLQAQSHSDIEHVIQDGASKDGTLDVVDQFTDGRTNLESARVDGIYAALNRGISLATGDVVALLHSDDLFAHSEVLSKIAAAFEDIAVQGVYCDLEYFARAQTSTTPVRPGSTMLPRC